MHMGIQPRLSNESRNTPLNAGTFEKRGSPPLAELLVKDYFLGRFLGGSRSRTPGPPPFASMNSTPAASNARRMTWSVARLGSLVPASS
jgi:hypothetical protein